MSRLSKTLACASVTVACTVATAGPAQAKTYRVTSGTTTITQSSEVAQFLQSHGITATAIAPATLGQGSLTMPIVDGKITKSGARGVLDLSGGVRYTAGKLKVDVRAYRITFTRHGGRLSARVDGHRIVIARIVPQAGVSGSTASMTASISASAAWVHFLNHFAGRQVATQGEDLGDLSSTASIG